MVVDVRHYLLIQVQNGQLIVVCVHRVFMDKIVIQVNEKQKDFFDKYVRDFSN
jgi:hypothetical protein